MKTAAEVAILLFWAYTLWWAFAKQPDPVDPEEAKMKDLMAMFGVEEIPPEVATDYRRVTRRIKEINHRTYSIEPNKWYR
jgi:hypothetical protein